MDICVDLYNCANTAVAYLANTSLMMLECRIDLRVDIGVPARSLHCNKIIKMNNYRKRMYCYDK
jgi:hypothetical protein